MKRLITLVAFAAALGLLVSFGGASAAVNAVTPSTNDINRTNGWAHVDQLSQGPGTTDLQFISTRSFYSCLEYRTDGDTSQILSENGGVNYNPFVTDGLYPYVCENNSSQTLTIAAKKYVEVRMVFGAETDERFDWTRFDVLPNCHPTGLVRDGLNLTAAVVNPTAPVSGPIDASGCNIGVYYGPDTTGTVSGADISGANYFGVVADGAAVNVTGSQVHDIGEVPFNGTQHGNAIYYTNTASGTISDNTVSRYQKNGITAVNGSSVTISGNTVTGEGPVTYIAQNGIEVGSGTSATVSGNTVSDNAYSGTNNASSGGILVFGGPCFGSAYTTGVSVTTNTLTNNDVGIYLYNADATCLATSPTKTQNKAVNNTITNSNTTNVSGNGYPNGYQAGISDLGNKDNIVNNKISGDGYNPLFEPTVDSTYTTIDTSGSQAAHVNNNK